MENTSHLHIEFFVETQPDEAETRKAGFPKFKEVELVRIKIVGDTKTVLVNPADAYSFDPDHREQMTYKERFPKHYEAFRAGREYMGGGTPLSELPGITGSKVAEFKAQNVHTIEALAQMDGPMLNKLGMFAREWKDKAVAWLAKAKDSAFDSKLAEQNEQLQTQLRIMQETIAQMQSDRGEPKAEPKGEAKLAVVTEGQFIGHDAAALKTYIKAKGGLIKGNPSLDTLKAMAEDIASKEGADA